MGWVHQFKAGWNAPAGSWRRRPYGAPPPADRPDEHSQGGYGATDELTRRDSVIRELIQELEQSRAEARDAREKLAAAEAEIANGATSALCRRFLKAALCVLHPDNYRAQKSIADPAAFVEARYKEIEGEVSKIAEFTSVSS